MRKWSTISIRFPQGCIVLCLALLGSSCIGGDDSQDPQETIDALSSALAGPIEAWTAGALKSLDTQISAGGIDLTSTVSSLEGAADRVTEAFCAELKADGSLASLEQAPEMLEAFIVTAMLSALTSSLAILNELQVRFPSFMLLDPALNPTWRTGGSSFADGYLKEYLRSKYLTSNDHVRLPERTSEEYDAFIRWTNGDDNRIAERARTLSDPILLPAQECLRDAQ